MRVALVHDFLLDLRGAERVFAAICDAWPEADVFTAVYDARGHRGTVRVALARRRRSCSACVPPRARSARCCRCIRTPIESLDLRGYDVVVSSSSAWAHGVLVDPGAVHVCYCHNPFRYAWSEREATLAARNPLTRPGPARAAVALAPVGRDRRPAGRPLRRQLRDHRRARAPLLRLRGRGPASAGGALALLARPGRSALPGTCRADGAQADRRRDPRVQRAPAAARGGGRRAGVAPAAPAGGADGAADRAAVRQRRGGSAAQRAGARGDRRGGVRDRGGRVARLGPAGDRAAPRRRAGDRAGGRDRHVLRRRRRAGALAVRPRSIRAPSTRPTASRRRVASASRASRSGCARSSPRPSPRRARSACCRTARSGVCCPSEARAGTHIS